MKTIYIPEASIRGLINEAMSDVVYRFMSPEKIVQMLDTDKIYLSLASNKADSFDKKRLFYLSTSRTKSVRNGYGRGKIARVELDGTLLNQRYKGKPIDYWGPTFNTPEYEDRLVSYSPTIDNARRYIKRIDLLVTRESYYNSCKDVIEAGKRAGVPVFVYDNENSFVRQGNDTVNSMVENAPRQEDEWAFSHKRNIPSYLASLVMIQHYDSVFNNPEGMMGEIYPELERFGLEGYCDKLKDILMEMRRLHFDDIIREVVLGNKSDIRFIARSGNGEGEKVARYAAWILRKHGVSNMEELYRKLKGGKDNEPSPSMDFVYFVRDYGYTSERLKRFDCPIDSIMNRDYLYSSLVYAIDDDAWNAENGEDPKIKHKSKSTGSFKAYVKRIIYGENSKWPDVVNLLDKTTGLNPEILEYLGIDKGLVRPFKVDRKKFKELAYDPNVWISYDDKERTIADLFGSYAKMYEFVE